MLKVGRCGNAVSNAGSGGIWTAASGHHFSISAGHDTFPMAGQGMKMFRARTFFAASITQRVLPRPVSTATNFAGDAATASTIFCWKGKGGGSGMSVRLLALGLGHEAAGL